MTETHNIQCSAINSNCISELIYHSIHRVLGAKVCWVDVINIPGKSQNEIGLKLDNT